MIQIVYFIFRLVWREIPGTNYCNTVVGCTGTCAQCDGGYCCNGDLNGSNGDCPKNAIDAVSSTGYRCVKEHDVLGKTFVMIHNLWSMVHV